MSLPSFRGQIPLSSLYHLLIVIKVEFHLLIHLNFDLLGLVLVFNVHLDDQVVLGRYKKDALVSLKQDLKDLGVSDLLIRVVLNNSTSLSPQSISIEHLVEVRITEFS